MIDDRDFRPGLVIPVYNHGATVGDVLRHLEPYRLPCWLVDDGSDASTRGAIDALAETLDWVRVHRLAENAGKGFALRLGYRLAAQEGISHVIQLDADGQHSCGDVGRFVAAMRTWPDALVLGAPIFDDSVPRLRLYARQLSRLSVWLCTLSFAIEDPLCGLRGVPVAPALRAIDSYRLGDHMEFEPGFAVVMYWSGVRILNLGTRIRYFPGGLSSFDAWRDSARMASLYLRLAASMPARARHLLLHKQTRVRV